MVIKKEIRKQILDAAWKRFGHYGYNKTTMAEIAQDCGMSAANLYRYFKDKSDIGGGIAKRYFDKEIKLIREVAQRTDLNPREKLEEVFLISFHNNFTEFENVPTIMELINFICNDRHAMIDDHKQEVVVNLVKIIDEGNNLGVFAVKDLEDTVKSIMFATLPFHATPIFLILKNHGYSKDDMENMVKKIMRLIIEGISKK